MKQLAKKLLMNYFEVNQMEKAAKRKNLIPVGRRLMRLQTLEKKKREVGIRHTSLELSGGEERGRESNRLQ
jgi:hypothetical protein